MTKEKKNYLIVLGVIICFCVIGNMGNCLKDKQILNHMQFTCARVEKIVNDRYGVKVFYSFQVKYVRYDKIAIVNKLYDYGIEKYINKQFIVVFDSLDLENNNIIMFQEHLSNYNLSIDNWNNCVDSLFRIGKYPAGAGY